MDIKALGGMLILSGVALVVLGLIFLLSARLPFLGKLPGDIVWQTGQVKIFAPLATCLLLSLILTILLNLFFGRK